MRILTARRCVWPIGASMLAGAACHAQNGTQNGTQNGMLAQRPIGSVLAADATVTTPAVAVSGVQPVNGREVLSGSATVTARDHTAPIALERGGAVLVCEGTAVHLAGSPDESLLLGLDRGAFEMKTEAKAGDVVLTPDLRFTMSGAGPLDLRLRVTSAGDTCVDNRGHQAPTLKIGDAFGESTYELKPEQHVTFEHGSLKEVVDRETVPCGCRRTI